MKKEVAMQRDAPFCRYSLHHVCACSLAATRLYTKFRAQHISADSYEENFSHMLQVTAVLLCATTAVSCCVLQQQYAAAPKTARAVWVELSGLSVDQTQKDPHLSVKIIVFAKAQ